MMLNTIICIFMISTQVNAKIFKSTCFDINLAQLGCSCSYPFYFTNTCPNGILNLNCELKNASLNDVLNQMDNYCWSQIYFENIHQLTSYVFKDIGFNLQCDIRLKNVTIVDKFAFKTIDNDVELTIEIDSTNIKLEKLCFGSINAKEIKILNNQNLSLLTSFFQASSINTLHIQYSNLTHFIRDSKYERIENLIIDNCVVDALLGDSYKLSGFERINTIKIISTGLSSLKAKIFSSYCTDLVQLHLNDNLIKHIEKYSLKGLNSLEYLNLENNPIYLIENSSFLSFKHSLRKLNLRSTQIVSLGNNLKNMLSLKEILLGNTKQLTDLESILNKQIEYLDLQNSNLITRSFNLNNFLNELDSILNSSKSNLFYIDTRSDNFNLDNYLFNVSYNSNGNCLWLNLKNVLIRVNENHECSCSLFYLYLNLSNFNFPYTVRDYVSYAKLTNDQMNNLTLWKDLILPLMPKCYRKLWFETYNLDKINENIFKCGLVSNHLVNCTNQIRTTTTIEHSSLFTTELIPIQTIPHQIIKLNNTPTILSCIIVFAVLFIIAVILKARHDYKSRFLKIFQKNFENLTVNSKELNSINVTSRHSFNVYSFNPEHILQQ